jgi:hypothetical protein
MLLLFTPIDDEIKIDQALFKMIKTLVVTTAIEREDIVFNYFLEKVAEGRNMIRK